MRNFIMGSIAGLALAALLALPAQAQFLCTDFEPAAQKLSQQFDEAPIFEGLNESGHRFLLFAAPGGATWTATLDVTPRDGNPRGMCIMTSGRALTPLRPPAKAPPLAKQDPS